jgi:hypothetical protein
MDKPYLALYNNVLARRAPRAPPCPAPLPRRADGWAACRRADLARDAARVLALPFDMILPCHGRAIGAVD